MSLAKRLRKLLEHPVSQVIVGLAMAGSGVAEIVHDLDEFGTLGAGHGVLLFGVANATKALMELVEGLEKVEEAEERRREPLPASV